MELKVMINNKEVSLREILETINKIYLITIDSCAYCEREGIKEDKQKLELIKKLIEGLGWKREK